MRNRHNDGSSRVRDPPISSDVSSFGRFAAAAAFALHGAVGRCTCDWRAAGRRTDIVFILSDDHRYDFMGFMERAPAFLETPAMDRMAARGAWSTRLSAHRCARRAGLDPHRPIHAPPSHRRQSTARARGHGVLSTTCSRPAIEQRSSASGTWDTSRTTHGGFDHWVSFKGQGVYFDPELNVNGQRKKFQGYTTDILTDHALDWLRKGRDTSRSFFLYLSHKAVHYPFQPAKRHEGRYAKRGETPRDHGQHRAELPHPVPLDS